MYRRGLQSDAMRARFGPLALSCDRAGEASLELCCSWPSNRFRGDRYSTPVGGLGQTVCPLRWLAGDTNTEHAYSGLLARCASDSVDLERGGSVLRRCHRSLASIRLQGGQQDRHDRGRYHFSVNPIQRRAGGRHEGKGLTWLHPRAMRSVRHLWMLVAIAPHTQRGGSSSQHSARGGAEQLLTWRKRLRVISRHSAGLGRWPSFNRYEYPQDRYRDASIRPAFRIGATPLHNLTPSYGCCARLSDRG